MIRGFRDKKTQQFFSGELVREFSSFRKVAERKLTMLDNASDLKDLLAPAGNRLERLKDDRAGQHSIRINESMADLFHLDVGRTPRRGDHRLSLKERES